MPTRREGMVNKNPEVEDGMGFSGLAPSHEERATERADKKLRDELAYLRGHRNTANAEITRLRAALAEAERLRPTLDDVRTQRDASDRENIRLRKALAEAERERDAARDESLIYRCQVQALERLAIAADEAWKSGVKALNARAERAEAGWNDWRGKYRKLDADREHEIGCLYKVVDRKEADLTAAREMAKKAILYPGAATVIDAARAILERTAASEPAFKPCIIQWDEVGATEMVLEDALIVYQPWGPFEGHAVDLGYNAAGRLVGIKIWDRVAERSWGRGSD